MAEETNPFADLPKYDEKAEKKAPPAFVPGNRVRIVAAERIAPEFHGKTATVVSPKEYEGQVFGGVCLHLDEPISQTMTRRLRDPEKGKYLRDENGKIKTEQQVQTVEWIQVHEKDIVKV